MDNVYEIQSEEELTREDYRDIANSMAIQLKKMGLFDLVMSCVIFELLEESEEEEEC